MTTCTDTLACNVELCVFFGTHLQSYDYWLDFAAIENEDYSITSSFSFTESPSQNCVQVALLSDFSVEGDHTFVVQLNTSNEWPMINTTGSTDIIIQDTNGKPDQLSINDILVWYTFGESMPCEGHVTCQQVFAIANKEGD